MEVVVPKTIGVHGAARLLADVRLAIADPSPGPIVLRGADGTFCDGLDIGLGEGAAGSSEIDAAIDAFAQSLALLQRSPKPTIALVDGDARGGGLGLAAACDVVVATEGSRFALPELLWGLLPALIYGPLRQRMSVQQIRLWLLLGSARTAAEAHAAGLVDEIAGSSGLDAASRSWRRRLARPRPDAVMRMRAFLAEDVTADAIQRGAALTRASLMDADLRASMRRFDETGELPWETR